MRRRLIVVGSGFVCGGLFIIGLAFAVGLSPVAQDLMRAGILGGAIPVGIGLVLIVAGLLRR